MDNNKISKYILIGFGLLVVGSFMRDIFIYGPRLREKGRYTIGYTYKYSQYKGGSHIYINIKLEISCIIAIPQLEELKKIDCLKRDFSKICI